MSWTIKGEAGQPLDATARSLESLRINACNLRFSSLASDVLQWTAVTDNATGAGTIIPAAGQIVELWDGAVRKFKGHATAPRIGIKSVTITVEGPWWWMSRIPLTQDQTDLTAGVAERTSFIFKGSTPTTFRSLAYMIATLLDRAIANGVPMANTGTIATTFDVCNITLANMDCGSALAELMRWCPDAVAWFDYSGTTPVINISRRKTGLAAGSMPTVTYTIGTDMIEENLDIHPRLDLEVLRTELSYVTRQAVTGLPQWASQTAGADIADSYGKRQMVSVSGPEIVAFLPKDTFETVSVQTGTLTNAMIAARDGVIGALGWSGYGNAINYLDYYETVGTNYSLKREYFPLLTYKLESGAIASLTGKRLVVSADPLPEWAVTQMGAQKVTITGTWARVMYSSPNNDAYWNAMHAAGAQGGFQGYAGANGTGVVYCKYMPFSIPAYLVPTAYNFPSATLVYKTQDFTYAHPPDNLAANLLECQNFVPYEGQITLVGDTVTGDNTLGYAVNVANSRTEHATMRAMQRAITYDLMRGRKTIELGTPARTDFGSLVSRVRRDPKDCIVYL